jgi:hypothetical protein
MSTLALKKVAKELIESMSPAQLKVASEFLAFIKMQPPDAATLELLSIPGFTASFARGVRDVKAGRTREWRKVRGDV